MNIGERIRLRRTELGLSQTDLGKRLGLTRAAVSKAELSKNDMTTDRIERYASALNCTSKYLMGWDDIIWDSETKEIEVIKDNNILKEIGELDLSNESMLNILQYAKYLKSQEEQ